MMQFLKMTISPYTHECSVLVWGAWRCTSTSSLANKIARLKYHLTTVVSFTEQGVQLIPSSTISQATRRCSSWRVVEYSRPFVAPLCIKKEMCKKGRRRRKLLDDLKERRGYSHLKDRTMWRARFGKGFGPVVRQTTKWMYLSQLFPLFCPFP
jgi:hypothetical protein